MDQSELTTEIYTRCQARENATFHINTSTLIHLTGLYYGDFASYWFKLSCLSKFFKKFMSPHYQALAIHCDGHILISFVFPQFTSSHSVFHSFHGWMNSINWPASSVWVFIAQLGEHCSANAEATGSNPVEAPKTFFPGYFAIA